MLNFVPLQQGRRGYGVSRPACNPFGCAEHVPSTALPPALTEMPEVLEV